MIDEKFRPHFHMIFISLYISNTKYIMIAPKVAFAHDYFLVTFFIPFLSLQILFHPLRQ